MKKDKIVKQFVYSEASSFNIDNFFDYLSNICQTFDISTPVLLSKHLSHFTNFNNAVFLKSDFVEQVNFDRLVLEDVSTN